MFKEIIAVYNENHAKPINKKYSVTDCSDGWYIYLPIDFKGLITNRAKLSKFQKNQESPK
jgi:hypothetical protein